MFEDDMKHRTIESSVKHTSPTTITVAIYTLLKHRTCVAGMYRSLAMYVRILYNRKQIINHEITRRHFNRRDLAHRNICIAKHKHTQSHTHAYTHALAIVD